MPLTLCCLHPSFQLPLVPECWVRWICNLGKRGVLQPQQVTWRLLPRCPLTLLGTRHAWAPGSHKTENPERSCHQLRETQCILHPISTANTGFSEGSSPESCFLCIQAMWNALTPITLFIWGSSKAFVSKAGNCRLDLGAWSPWKEGARLPNCLTMYPDARCQPWNKLEHPGQTHRRHAIPGGSK